MLIVWDYQVLMENCGLLQHRFCFSDPFVLPVIITRESPKS